MTKKKNCTDCGACSNVDGKVTAHETTIDTPIAESKETINYGFYSKILQKPYDSLSELMAAEEVYTAEQRAKEDKAAQKKLDAQKVEDAFKALNAARKIYKEDLAQLTKEYGEALETIKKSFEFGKKDIHNKLAVAEDAYAAALKEFTDKYDNYHMTLTDGDFETTISGSTGKGTLKETEATKATNNSILDIFDVLFGL